MASAPPMDKEEYLRVKLTMPRHTVEEIANKIGISLDEAMQYEKELANKGGRKSRRHSKKSRRHAKKSRRHGKKCRR